MDQEIRPDRASWRASKLEAIQRLVSVINSEPDRDSILAATCETACQLFDVKHSRLVIFDDDGEPGRVQAEFPELGTKHLELPVKASPLEHELISSKQPVVLSDVAEAENLAPLRAILQQFDIRSILVVPVIAKGRVLGSLSLDAVGERRAFTVDEVELCQMFASHVAVAVENAQLFMEAKRRTEQMATLRQTTLAITSTLDRDTLLETIVRNAVDLLEASGGGFYEYKQSENVLIIAADERREGNLLGKLLKPGEGMAGRLLQSGEAYLRVDNYDEWPDRADVFQGFVCFGAVLEVPVTWLDEVLGVLYVDDRVGRHFSDDDVKLLRQFADHVAIALNNAGQLSRNNKQLEEHIRLREEAERHRQLLSALDEASRNIRAEKETTKLLQEIVRLAVELVGFDAGGLYLVQRHLSALELHGAHRLPVEAAETSLPYTDPVIGQVVHDGKPLVVKNYTPWPGKGQSYESFVALPMKQPDGEVEAILFVAESEGSRPFLDLDLEILARFVVQAALALQTSRLINQEQRSFRQLALLQRIGDYIRSAGELDTILHVVLTGVTAGYGLGFNRAALFLLDESGRHLVGRTGIGHLQEAAARADWDRDRRHGLTDLKQYFQLLEDQDLPATPIHERIFELQFSLQESHHDVFSQALHERRGILVTPDGLNTLPPTFVEAFEPSLPLIIVPLLVEERGMGLLVADNKFTQAPITDHDVESLFTFVNTAAIAIRNSQLFQRAEAAREHLRASYEASNALISARQPAVVLEEIIEQARSAADAAWVSIILIEEGGEAQVLMTTGGIDDKMRASDVIRRDGISLEVMETGSAVAIDDVEAHEGGLSSLLVNMGVRAALCLPLTLQGKQIGVMWLLYDRARVFARSEVDALLLFVNQAAIAYDSARRLEALDRMRQAAEALASAANLEEVLNQIVASAREVLRADSSALWSYDDVRHTFILKSSVASGIPGAVWRAFRKQEPQPGQTAFTVMEEQWVAVENVDDRQRYPYLGETTRSLLSQIGVVSFQGIALTVGAEKQGVLYVNYNSARTFDDQERETARTFANHAALALKKAKLLEQVSKAHNTARAVAEMSTLTKLEETLRSVVEGTRNVLDCAAVTLYVYDYGKERLLYPPQMTGVDYPQRAQRLTGVADNSIVMTMLKKDGIYVVDNTADDPLFVDRRFTNDEGIVSLASIPLRVGKEKVGVMFVNYRSEHRFTGDELRNIDLFANQAAVAIHGAQLFDRVQARATALQALYDAGRTITGSLNLETILMKVTEQVRQLTGVEGREATFCSLALLEGTQLKPAAVSPQEHFPDFERTIGIRDIERDRPVGITGLAVRRRETQLVGDVSEEPEYLVFNPETRAELAVPLKIKNQVIGVINVEHPEKNAFDEEDAQALEALASQAASAIRNAQSHHEASILREVSFALVGTLEFDAVIALVMNAAMELTNTESGSLLFWDEEQQLFSPAYTTGGPGRKLVPYETTARRGGLAWTIIHEKESKIVTDTLAASEISDVAIAKGRRSLIGVPIHSGTQSLGVMYVNSSDPREFSEHQMALLGTLANQAAAAIHRAHEYMELRRTNEELRRTKERVEMMISVAWMGTVAGAWRHSVGNLATIIGDVVKLIRQDRQRGELIERLEERLEEIEEVVAEIQEVPMFPLSSEDDVESVPINQLLGDRIRLFQQKQGRYRKISFEMALSTDPHMTVRASSEWLRRVIDTVVDNAVEAMKTTETKMLTIQSHESDGQVKIAFKDSGKGIPSQLRKRIFEGPIPKKKGERGSGLGLYLARTIVRAYGGTLDISSTGSDGTTILITFPSET